MFKFKKYYNKRHIAINRPQNTPLALNTLIPSFLPLSEAVLEVLFRECF
jgi:glutamate mutase epsilon subunit